MLVAEATELAAPASVRINTTVLSHTNAEYASWNIDASANRGFFHVNFTNPNLRAAAASLVPSVMRFGGSGNDFLVYDSPDQPCPSPMPAPPSPKEYGEQDHCLNVTHWDNLASFAAAGGAKMLFGASYHMNAACAARAARDMQPSRALIHTCLTLCARLAPV